MMDSISKGFQRTRASDARAQRSMITKGRVVDTNDPHQMGRLRIACPMWGDQANPTAEQIQHLPWAMYVSPFAGSTNQMPQGAGEDISDGTMAYGMWNIPKLGANVLVTMLDDDPAYRMWLGCVYEHSTPHTMPHGRFNESDGNRATNTNEVEINPLSNSLKAGFGTDKTKYEWRTRASDYSVAAVDAATIQSDNGLTSSKTPDDKDVEISESDGNTTTRRNGYAKRREADKVENSDPYTDGQSYSSQVYSWVSPGFHAISMDDRPENCRMRFRTTTGHQILLDDTNERIYISTQRGENWMEMDTNGNIDVFSNRRLSIHAANDINMTAGESIRFQAPEIHITANDTFKVHAETGPIDIRAAAGDLRVCAEGDIKLETNANLSSLVADDFKMSTGKEISMLAGTGAKLTASSGVDIDGGSYIKETAGRIDMNGPAAAKATAAPESDEVMANLPNRVPGHERDGGFARILSDVSYVDVSSAVSFGRFPEAKDMVVGDLDNTVLEFDYDDPNVGREERYEQIVRGPFWHR